MKNTIISLFFCLLLGLVMSFYLFKQYDVPVSKEAETLTFLQTAVYSDLDSLQKNININQFPDSYKRGLRKELKNDNNKWYC